MHWVLVFHIVNYWGLHCVPILEPQTLNGNINVSGIVLVQYPCLSPAYSPVQRLDALCRTCPDDARLDWILHSPAYSSAPTYSPSILSPQSRLRVSNPKFSFFLLWNRLLEVRPSTSHLVFVTNFPTSPISRTFGSSIFLLHQVPIFGAPISVFVTNFPTSLISWILN